MTPRAHALVVLLALVSLAFIARLLRHRRLSAKYAVVWLFLGLGGLAVAVWPGTVDNVSDWLGIPNGATTAFLAAIAVLLFVCVYHSWELSRLEERSRTLAQEVALLRQRCTELEAGGGGPLAREPSPPPR